MIAKGNSVAGASRLAVHLGREDTNERIQLIETRGVISEDLHGALKEMDAVASMCPNCTRPFYHLSINTPTSERMTDDQRTVAIDRFATALGLENQPRVVMLHVKNDREHVHVVFSRIDTDRERVIGDSHNYRKHELVARQLEREFGHARVQGAHVEREGVSRPERTPSHKDMQQAERTKIPVAEAKAHVSELWKQSDNGKSFEAALQDSGWTLCKGDRRDFVVVDPRGGVHSLTRVTGVTAADVRNHMSDVMRDGLPSPDDVRERLKREQETEREADKAKRGKQHHGKEAISREQQALKDAVRLSGNQSMANLDAVQMQRLRRNAERAERERGSGDAAAVKAARERHNRLRETGEAHKETNAKQAARLARDKAASKTVDVTKQKGRDDTDSER